MSVDGWQLDATRERYVRPKTEGTEMLSFRCVSTHARTLDEIIHTGIDPRLKTKSDALQDAVFMFIENWVDQYSSAVPGHIRRMVALEQLTLQRQSRQQFIDAFDEEFEQAKKSGDSTAITVLQCSLQEELNEANVFSPRVYLDELNERMEKIRTLL